MKLVSKVLACAMVCASLAGAFSRQTFSAVPPQAAQQAAAPTRVLGTVTAIDPAAMRASVLTDAGETVTVMLAADTKYLRVPPEAKTFESGTKISVAEVSVGDRVYAGGKYTAETKSVAARLLVVMSKSDIERRRESERAEWRRRGLAGTVTAVDAAKGEIKISLLKTQKPLTVNLKPETLLRRVGPEVLAALGPARPQPAASPQPAAAAPAAPSPKGVDLQEMLDRLSPLAFDQVKPGQMIVVSSTKGADPNRVTAITVIAGLDPLLRQPPPPRGRTPPNPNTGLPSGVLDFAIGLP